jgi:hypothetical protein
MGVPSSPPFSPPGENALCQKNHPRAEPPSCVRNCADSGWSIIVVSKPPYYLRGTSVPNSCGIPEWS